MKQQAGGGASGARAHGAEGKRGKDGEKSENEQDAGGAGAGPKGKPERGDLSSGEGEMEHHHLAAREWKWVCGVGGGRALRAALGGREVSAGRWNAAAPIPPP